MFFYYDYKVYAAWGEDYYQWTSFAQKNQQNL